MENKINLNERRCKRCGEFQTESLHGSHCPDCAEEKRLRELAKTQVFHPVK